MKIKTLIIIFLVLGLVWLTWYFLRKPASPSDPVQTAIPGDSSAILWYKNTVIYTLDVEVFKDSNGDGIGDFNGLTEKLGYIDSLGATAIWLAPFQPTPNLDDGYDVSDFYKTDPRLGSDADFTRFMQSAKDRGIRIIMDLVVNHTSDQHPWFQQARKDSTSEYYSWYVWSKQKPDNYDKGMIFPGVQKSIWTYDSLAGKYYLHRFYEFQPDLNTQNPKVLEEIRKIIAHWMNKGVSGFRLDAVPFVIEVPETKGEKFEQQYDILTAMRHYVDSINKEAIILGEANVAPEETENYFGKQADRMHMMFNFFANQHMFLSLATGDAEPLKKSLKETTEIPHTSQWGQFLRNHDEVDLGRLSKKERQKVYDVFGPAKTMQLYDRGIRRRLAPMMNNNIPQLEMAYSLMFSLPSTPVMRYGDEIGMGDDLKLKERESVRTPMQWTTEKNGGFTSGLKPARPVIDTGVFAYSRVNVLAQQTDSNSMLNWSKRLMHLRLNHQEIGLGTWKMLETDNAHVIAIIYEWGNKRLIAMHNLSDKKQMVNIDTDSAGEFTAEGLLNKISLKSSANKLQTELNAFGYDWFSGGTP